MGTDQREVKKAGLTTRIGVGSAASSESHASYIVAS